MIEKIKELIVKYREIIVYIIVGGICTVVSWGCKFLWNQFVFGGPLHPTALQTSILSIVTWVSGVAVAYPLNRKFVFLSHGPWVPECLKFCGSRVSTFFLDLFLTEVLGPLLGINVFVVTLISAVLVTIANYIFSKVFVFNKKDSKTEEK
ncbi:MAG: GtrA family protein [Lachnospiraceae bacterium]|jgi:putative flippase GtrA|nr:GtrA family protein [Lachnospiraceae bacterium]MBR5357245.1 GtrA family protein [Lachnospiraceae bacterium]MCR4934372.1 GtrA family protein [Lachnospiraceae bacterium]